MKIETNWDPDAVAPHVGDVYERETADADWTGFWASIFVGFTIALMLTACESVARTGTIFGMAF